MSRRALGGMLVSLWLIFAAPFVCAAEGVKSFHEEMARAWDSLGHEIWGLFGNWREHLGTALATEDRPLISMMLRNREKLGLTGEQARNLERLRTDFEKESIRKDADLRVAEMDLKALREGQSVDMSKVEGKVREIERLRADLRLARIRAIEKGKEELTADQRKKLQELIAEPQFTRIQPRREP
jgi:Spy/CpxP family protein refolding chaperone